MKLNKNELKEMLREVERMNGKGWQWFDIPAFVRKYNEKELKEIINETKEGGDF
jgi:hypothetical protein